MNDNNININNIENNIKEMKMKEKLIYNYDFDY